jgi:hypothetical protein
MSVHGYWEGGMLTKTTEKGPTADNTLRFEKNAPIWPVEEELEHERFFFFASFSVPSGESC